MLLLGFRWKLTASIDVMREHIGFHASGGSKKGREVRRKAENELNIFVLSALLR